MAFNQIPVNTGKRWGALIMSARGNLLSALVQLKEAHDKMNACITDVGGSEMVQIEDQFGVEAGKGQALYDETSSLIGYLNSDDTSTVQRAAIKAAMAQWIARVG